MHIFSSSSVTKAAALMLACLLAVISNTAYAEPEPATYAVTIENRTTAGQPFTPPVVVVHRQAIELFQVGNAASFEVKEIAENGNLSPMLALLENSKHVYDFVVAAAGDPPPLMPGQAVTVEVESAKGAKYLSFVSMLICTNDGFTGLNTLRLPKQVGDETMVYAKAYDAGTEINTEDFADIVPPCPALTGVSSDEPGTGTSNPALAENGVITPHPGIQGDADLIPAVHDWTDPVAQITVTRLD